MSIDRTIKIAPSILSADFADFGREIQAIEAQKALAERSLEQAEALFGGLLQGVFGG